jgi:peptidoglycan/LPS O-acetylase OafA/YrhL
MPPMSQTRRQDPSIQALRGLAVILLVAFHVIGSSNRGLRVPDSSVWHYSSLALEDIRMPLFTLISGYVYAMVPVTRWRDCPQLIKGKSRRLLLPLITVSTLMYILGRVVPGTNFDDRDIAIWRVYFFGFQHLWFLQAIFIIFIVVSVLDSLGALDSKRRWFIIISIAAIADIVITVPVKFDFFTVSGALGLLPFFLLGYGLRRHALFDLRGVPAAATATVFVAIYTIRLLIIFGYYRPDEHVVKSVGLVVATMGVVLIYSARNMINVKLLAWIGGFSFGIYLLHVFATAATRILLEHAGIHRTWELFAMGLFMGIAAPIMFQIAFRNVAVVRTFVLGERGFRGFSHCSLKVDVEAGEHTTFVQRLRDLIRGRKLRRE